MTADMTNEERQALARVIVRKVLDDLLGYTAFRRGWDGADQVVKKEIRDGLRNVVDEVLRRELGP